MTRLQKFEPFREMMSLRDAFNSLVEGSFVRPGMLAMPAAEEGVAPLPLDISETPEEYVVKASLPGVKPEDVEVSVHDDLLTIRGETKFEEEKKEKNWVMRERRAGMTQRTVRLASPVRTEKAVARFENGVLTLALPKTEVTPPRKIKVEPVAVK
ncbi:MAG: Hsp20/alpha crystallin family protein [Gemmataceae bacterium]|nr:Hsp20/alpha crystallin family protein [Gemmataceae bacterium]